MADSEQKQIPGNNSSAAYYEVAVRIEVAGSPTLGEAMCFLNDREVFQNLSPL